MKKRLFSVLLSLIIASMPFTAIAASVTDISGNWAEKEIQYFIDEGIIVGYGDGTFGPEKPVTRAEFVRIVNKTFKYGEPTTITFKDVKTNDWYYNDVRYAVAAGFISGYSDNTFRPNNNITREEVASIIVRILKLQQNYTYAPTVFDDVDASSHYNGAIGALTSIGIMKGVESNKFMPRSNETRADTAYSLYNAFFNGSTENTLIDGNLVVRKNSYGPSSEFNKETVNKVNVKSSATQTTIRNLDVLGDFVLEDTVERVFLENVTIKGKLIINGGSSLDLDNVNVQEMDVNNQKSSTTIYTSKDSVCYNSNIYTSCTLSEASNEYVGGFSNVVINGTDNRRIAVNLSGQFVAVDLYSPEAAIELSSGHISDLYINSAAEGSTITLNNNSRVETLEINAAKVAVKGAGAITTAKIEAANITMQTVPGTLTGSYAPRYSSDVDNSNVTITVVNRNNSPVSSATVKIYGITKTTNDDGKASFVNIPSGTHEYSVEKSGFTTVSGSIDTTNYSTTRTVTISGTNQYGLTINVYDNSDNSYISSASVTLLNNSTSTTSSNGSVSFGSLENGVYSYTVSKSGYQSASGTVTVNGNTSKTVMLIPTTTSYNAEFYIQDGSNNAVSGATIILGSRTGTTNSSGYVKITGINAGTHSYTISKAGYSTLTGTVKTSSSMAPIHLAMSANTFTATINVYDSSNSTALQNASVTLSGHGSVSTDGSGNAEFSGLSPGTYNVDVVMANYNSFTGSITINNQDFGLSVPLTPVPPVNP